FACWSCNLKKGPNLSGIDPATGQITALFHPRQGGWPENFFAHVGALMRLGIEIRAPTPVGRATVRVLGLNEEMRQMVRYELWMEGLYTVRIRGRRELRRQRGGIATLPRRPFGVNQAVWRRGFVQFPSGRRSARSRQSGTWTQTAF